MKINKQFNHVTLNTIRKLYRKELKPFIERASIEEINQFSNSIHHGVSKKGCGVWSDKLKTFTSCDNENCRMLSSCLGEQKVIKMASPYYEAFSLQNQEPLEIPCANALNQLVSLINEKFNHITLIGHIKQKPEITVIDTLIITFALIESTKLHRMVLIGKLAELYRELLEKVDLVSLPQSKFSRGHTAILDDYLSYLYTLKNSNECL